MKLGALATALGAALLGGWWAAAHLVAPGPDDLLGLVALAAVMVAGPIAGPALAIAGLVRIVTALAAPPERRAPPPGPRAPEASWRAARSGPSAPAAATGRSTPAR